LSLASTVRIYVPQVLYDALRPALIAVQSLDELCELVDILKHEVRNLIVAYTFALLLSAYSRRLSTAALLGASSGQNPC